MLNYIKHTYYLPLQLYIASLYHKIIPIRPDRGQGKGLPTGEFMAPGGIGQFWGAELKMRWYTGVRWGFKPQFHDFKSCSG